MIFVEKGAQEFLGHVFGEIMFHINAIHRNINNITPEQYASSEIVRDALAMRLISISKIVLKHDWKILDKFDLREKFPFFPWNSLLDFEKDYKCVNIVNLWDSYIKIVHNLEQIINYMYECYPTIKSSAISTLLKIEFSENMDIKEFKRLFNIDN